GGGSPSAFPRHIHQHPPGLAPAPRITSNLYPGDVVATNSHLLLFTHCISTIINISLEVANTLCPDVRYLHVPVMDGPTTRISSCFDSMAATIHGWGHVGSDAAALCCWGEQVPTICLADLQKNNSTSLAGTHAWIEPCHPILQPNNGFWQQLIYYEYKHFSINRLQKISSPLGLTPNVYENELGVMLLL
uniref:Dual specificity phosphatase 21 n=1 Tax=Athene cunicularia TaxID=194338 RepID=A0A663LX35_ATHCN